MAVRGADDLSRFRRAASCRIRPRVRRSIRREQSALPHRGHCHELSLMASTNRRPDRVAAAIREEVATFLNQDVKDPRVVGLVTVTGVDVSRDLRVATVYVSIYGSEAERAATADGLASVASHLRARIGRSLRLRLAPEIVFKPDETIARAARIDTLLSQLKDAPPPSGEDERDSLGAARRQAAWRDVGGIRRRLTSSV